jgi:hypothetical protein
MLLISPPPSDDRVLRPGAAWLVFGIVIVLWLSTPLLVWLAKSTWPVDANDGQFGDLFGSVNALFSGLAFAGVVVAILLQLRELELQRNEMRTTIYAQAYKVALDVLQADDVIEARRFVFSTLKGKPLPWNEQETKAAETVARSYDAVGTMVEYNMLPAGIITDSWGASLRQAWPILRPLIEQYRADRLSPEIWDNFEFLAAEASKAPSHGGHLISK